MLSGRNGRHRSFVPASGLIFIIMTLLFAALPLSPVYAGETGTGQDQDMTSSGLPPKKIVSIVFDDSSSMGTDWVDENYATQVFAALLNPRDEMYLTYMSERVAGRIDLTDVKASVRKIREKEMASGGTYLETVDVAYDELEKSLDSDPETQYWLVILTDGGFDSSGRFGSLENAFSQLKMKKMSNGSPLHIYYFGIGSSASVVNPDPANNLEALSSTDIVGTLGDVANTVSGRLKYDKKDIVKVDDHTLKVNSGIPLYSLTAFTQNSDAQVASAEAAGTEQSSVKLTHTNVKVERPDPDKAGYEKDKKTDLKGNVSVISGQDRLIPSGTYTITFTGPVDLDSTVIMYQPAVNLELQLLRDGKVITDYKNIYKGDDLEIRLLSLDPISGKELDSTCFPEGTKWEIDIDKDGVAETAEGTSASLPDVEQLKYVLRGKMTMPGMPPVNSGIIAFKPIFNPDAYFLDPEKKTGTIPRAKLPVGKNYGDSPFLWITRDDDQDGDGHPDGNPVRLSKDMTGEEITAVVKDLSVTADDFGLFLNRAGRVKVEMELRQKEDGSFVLCPATSQKRWFFLTLLAPYAIRTGHYSATAELPVNGRSETLQVDLTGKLTDWIPLILEIIAFLILRRLWYVIFVKPKFARGTILELTVYVRDTNGYGFTSPAQNEQILLKPYGEHPFAKKPAEIRIRTLNLTVHANATGYPYIDTKTAYQNGKWGAAEPRQTRRGINFNGIVSEITQMTKARKEGNSGEPEMYTFTTTPTFFYDGTSQLYALTLTQR